MIVIDVGDLEVMHVVNFEVIDGDTRSVDVKGFDNLYVVGDLR
jgi:hypothetical protein